MITKTPRFTILIVAMTILGTGGPITAFATDIGGNDDDDDSLADTIIENVQEDVNRIIDEELSELPTIPPVGSGGAFCAAAAATIVGTDGG
jgi:hypothetical protein